MSQAMRRNLRLYFSQAWLAYHSRFAITNPFGYFTAKFGFAFFLMIFFLFMAKYLGFLDPQYIIIGNMILIPANGSLCGLTLSIGDEREWGTLSYVIGSPASRAIIFLGKSFFYVLDGFLTALIGFGIAGLILHIDFSQIDFGLVLTCVFITACTSTGLGFIFGSISLTTRDGWPILNTFLSLLYILVGVNFPVEALPGILQPMAYWLPLTRGLQAARLALEGAGWGAVRMLILGEALVGGVYILLGFLMFLMIEKRSTRSGSLDAY
jgi:ABC-2 type transport system permease protein